MSTQLTNTQRRLFCKTTSGHLHEGHRQKQPSQGKEPEEQSTKLVEAQAEKVGQTEQSLLTKTDRKTYTNIHQTRTQVKPFVAHSRSCAWELSQRRPGVAMEQRTSTAVAVMRHMQSTASNEHDCDEES
jgi:hypothetical protein